MNGEMPARPARVTPSLSVVIPTYGREELLLATLDRVEALFPAPGEIVVVDQTERHETAVERELAARDAAAGIRWLRLPRPSITGAMNAGLLAARGEYVLYLDDDVVPKADLVAAHLAAHHANHLDARVEVVAGQVLQPGEEPEPLVGREFRFRSSVAQEVVELMGGNFSVRRAAALSAGGFDERFVAVAYRYEREFCDRIRRHGGRIWFEPTASIHHLQAARGGTRAWGSHLRSLHPGHSVGEYYYHLRRWRHAASWRGILRRVWKSVATRHHLRRPWWIPVTLLAEGLGILWGLSLALRGPRLLPSPMEGPR